MPGCASPANPNSIPVIPRYLGHVAGLDACVGMAGGSSTAHPAGEDKNQHPDDCDSASAIGPLNLASHEAAGEHVDALQDPDNSHADHQHSQNSENESHNGPHLIYCCESYLTAVSGMRGGRGAVLFPVFLRGRPV